MTESRYDILFEPVKIGPVTAPNRFFAVPHATGHGWNQPSGAIALRSMKAEGGWGTVAVQITEIAPDTDMANHPMERIWDDSDIPRHQAQVNEIKKHGALAAVELGHGGMRARNITTGLPVIGPSSFPVLRPEVPVQARAMDKSDINAFRKSHKHAAQRAVIAGYDILYVYAAHDISLFSNFISVNTNKRTDEYGGSLDNRVRLLKEVLQDTHDVAAGKCAVALRFSVAEPGRKNGLTHDGEGRDIVEALAELPDLWDVNISGWSNDSATARFSDEGFQLQYTDFVKTLTSKPVVGVGRFTSPDMMVAIIKKGRLDLIGGARASIADPYLPNKIKENRIEDIRECIGCNICVSMDSYGLPIRCTQNPTVSEEWRRGWHPENPAAHIEHQSHLIVGAGPAGLECALTLAKTGDKVTLADAENEVGGRVLQEAQLPGLQSWIRVRDYRLHQLRQKPNVEIYLNSYMTANDIVDFEANTVTLATGASWRRDGIGSSNFDTLQLDNTTVFSADDILANVSLGSNKSRVVVYDDEHFYMASALAEKLQMEGHQITYVTPLPSISTWTENTLEQARIIDRLGSLGIVLVPNVKLDNGPTFHNTLTNKNLELVFDCLVFVGARISNESLYFELKATGQINKLYRTGDCLSPGIIQNAILSGHQVARQILAGESTAAMMKRDQVLITE